VAAPIEPGTQQAGARAAGPAPWKWRTFPVYFAFALGAFLGLYMGILSEWARREGADWIQTALFVAVAIMLGLGLSRLTTRWLIRRRLIRARQRR
jgi:hypothetical protein